MKIDWRIIVCGIICLTIAECVALSNGINGTVYSLYIFIIACAIGVMIPNPLGGKNSN